MQTVPETPAITSTASPSRAIETDLLVIPVFEDDSLDDEPDLDPASGGAVEAARARGEFTGKAFELFVTVARGWSAKRVVLVGAGLRKDFSADRLRRVAITGALAARQRRVTSIALVYRPGTSVGVRDAVQVLTEGAVLANFDGAVYKTKPPAPTWIEKVQVRVEGDSAVVASAIERGRVLGEYTNIARRLSNEPSNVLTPRAFAAQAVEIAARAGLGVEILDESRIAELKMGLLLGVARGSQEPPR